MHNWQNTKKVVFFIVLSFFYILIIFFNFDYLMVFAQTITEPTDTKTVMTTTPEINNSCQLQVDQLTQENENLSNKLISFTKLSNKGESFNTIGSIVAIFIGIFALAVSLWQGYETRKNYRLSVTPKITFYGHWRNDTLRPGIYLKNKGLGPAIIKKVEVFFDKKLINNKTYGENITEAITKAYDNGVIPKLSFFIMVVDEVIASGENQILIGLTEEYKNDKNIDDLNKAFSRVSIKTTYWSIYDQEYFKVCDVSSYEFQNGSFVER